MLQCALFVARPEDCQEFLSTKGDCVLVHLLRLPARKAPRSQLIWISITMSLRARVQQRACSWLVDLYPFHCLDGSKRATGPYVSPMSLSQTAALSDKRTSSQEGSEYLQTPVMLYHKCGKGFGLEFFVTATDDENLFQNRSIGRKNVRISNICDVMHPWPFSTVDSATSEVKWRWDNPNKGQHR